MKYQIPLTTKELEHFQVSKDLIEMIQKRFSYHLYLVGGASRDLIQNFFFKKNKLIHDLDFSIFKDNGDGLSKEELIELKEFILLDRRYSIVDDTIFLHLNIIENSTKFEVEFTSFRKESYRNNRKPITVGGDITTDIQRRDFTVNAIYLNVLELNEKDIIVEEAIPESKDFIEDVKLGILRTTTENPMDVFEEDPLRILRAIRFKEYGFILDSKMEEAMIDFPMKIFFEKVSKERIQMELLTILERGDVNYLIHFGFIRKLIPAFSEFEFKSYRINELEHIASVIREARKLDVDDESKKIFLLAALFHDVGKGSTGTFSTIKNRFQFLGHEHISAEIAREWLTEFKFSKRIINGVYHLVKEHMTTKFFNNKSLKSIVRWILLYIDDAKFPNLINNILMFNKLDWGGKSVKWRRDNIHLIEDEERISILVKDLVIFIKMLKIEKKEVFQNISIEIGNDKHIPVLSKRRAINKRHSNFIVAELKRLGIIC